MKFNQIVDFGFASWKQSYKQQRTPSTICLLGQPGIGKTATGFAIAEKIQEYLGVVRRVVVQARDLTSALPEDMAMPLPLKQQASYMLRYAFQEWFVEFCKPDAVGVLILDDISAASPAIQAAFRQLVLDRMIHGMHLSDGVLVIVTGNRREDMSGATMLPAHFRNSVLLLELEASLNQWNDWFSQQEYYVPSIVSYLHWKPEFFCRQPTDAGQLGSFATPRAWTLFAKDYQLAKQHGILPEVAAGRVGEAPAVEYINFLKIQEELYDIEALLKNPRIVKDPKAEFKDNPDVLIALSTGMAQHSITALKEHPEKAEQICSDFIRGISWITDGPGREYLSVSIHVFSTYRKGFTHLLHALHKIKVYDENVADMYQQIREMRL